ncbi:DUF397 domain-containing protein [Streptomyces sp. SYSU K21746]
MSSSLRWQKSSFSGGGSGDDCVELAATPAGIHLRESDRPASVLTTPSVRALIGAIKTGRFAQSAAPRSSSTQWQKSSFSGTGDDNNCVELGASRTGVHLRESEAPGTALTTTPRAVRALIAAIKAGAPPRTSA